MQGLRTWSEQNMERCIRWAMHLVALRAKIRLVREDPPAWLTVVMAGKRRPTGAPDAPR